MKRIRRILTAVDDYFGGDGACWIPFGILVPVIIVVGLPIVMLLDLFEALTGRWRRR